MTRVTHRAWGLIGVALFALGTPLTAQSVSVRAFVTPGTTIAIGSAFVLNVEVSGTQSMNRDVAPPDLGAFARFLGSNTQSSVQMVNGQIGRAHV